MICKEKYPKEEENKRIELYNLFHYKVLDKKYRKDKVVFTIEKDDTNPHFYSKDDIYRLSLSKSIPPMWPTYLLCAVIFIVMTVYLILMVTKALNVDKVTLFLMFGLPSCLLVVIVSLYNMFRFKVIKAISTGKKYSFDELKKMLEEKENGN